MGKEKSKNTLAWLSDAFVKIWKAIDQLNKNDDALEKRHESAFEIRGKIIDNLGKQLGEIVALKEVTEVQKRQIESLEERIKHLEDKCKT